MHRGKRWLYLIHRWIGIATCLLLAMWVISGVVMMYVPYPSLTAGERMAGLAPIDWSRVKQLPDPSLRADASGHPRGIVLEQGAQEPVWRVRTGTGEQVISATTGAALAPIDERAAARIAGQFGKASVTRVTPVERDQWTVAGGYDRFRPLWKAELNGADGRILYVSSVTGAVVQDTLAGERFWNWLGAVPHWLYPTILRQDQPLWRQVVLWTSGFCIVAVVSGMWIGILRARFRRRYKGGRITPYRGWQWWHHVLGLTGGTLLTTWIVSGWLSVDPGRWFASPGLSDAGQAAFAGSAMVPAIDWARVGTLPAASAARRMRLIPAAGRMLLVFEHADLTKAVADAATLAPVRFGTGELVRRSALLVPGYAIRSAEILHNADNYWYEAKGSVELPVLRVIFADPAQTWAHISLETGEMLGDIDARRRTYRWLYDGLHRWDMQGFITRRPLWDVWMWLWSIAATIVAVSGVVIGWRRLMPRRQSHALAK
ncbi:MAG: hypothetical protein KF730_03115 [Sphingomonas sp.]|nr:hypothetical protein [Sphingomonas sp.]